jgi:hypothetical protein
MPKVPKLKYWNRNHVKMVLDNAHNVWGRGWRMLSDDAKDMTIKAEVASLVLAQDESLTFNSEVVWELYAAASRLAGLME